MTMPDAALLSIIRDTLMRDERTAGQTIDVLVSEGLVVLFGRCDEEHQAQVAVTLAKGLVGVRDVLDRIERRPISQRKAA